MIFGDPVQAGSLKIGQWFFTDIGISTCYLASVIDPALAPSQFPGATVNPNFVYATTETPTQVDGQPKQFVTYNKTDMVRPVSF